MDDLKVLSGSIHGLRHGLPWVDAPPVDGPHTTLYNRFRPWSHNGVLELLFCELAQADGTQRGLMMGATDLKAHGTASSPHHGEGALINSTTGFPAQAQYQAPP